MKYYIDLQKYMNSLFSNTQGRELLRSLIDFQECRVKIFTTVGDSYIPVIIRNTADDDVNQRMLDGGFADRLFGKRFYVQNVFKYKYINIIIPRENEGI